MQFVRDIADVDCFPARREPPHDLGDADDFEQLFRRDIAPGQQLAGMQAYQTLLAHHQAHQQSNEVIELQVRDLAVGQVGPVREALPMLGVGIEQQIGVVVCLRAYVQRNGLHGVDDGFRRLGSDRAVDVGQRTHLAAIGDGRAVDEDFAEVAFPGKDATRHQQARHVEQRITEIDTLLGESGGCRVSCLHPGFGLLLQGHQQRIRAAGDVVRIVQVQISVRVFFKHAGYRSRCRHFSTTSSRVAVPAGQAHVRPCSGWPTRSCCYGCRS